MRSPQLHRPNHRNILDAKWIKMSPIQPVRSVTPQSVCTEGGIRRRPQWREGGIEEQTRKLFEVCRLRDVPIIPFVNKLGREGRDPFELRPGCYGTTDMTFGAGRFLAELCSARRSATS
jgi:hypothetical protein